MQHNKIIIAGGRDFANYSLLKNTCDNLLRESSRLHDIVIVSGHAKGTDLLGEQYARERGYGIETYPADWRKHGRVAGPIRNFQMAGIADALIAFWDGKSRGTKNMIDLANRKGLEVAVIRY